MRALEFLEPDQLVAIDGSSTNLQFAKNIPDNLKLTVLTNSYSIAHVCSLKEQIRVIILGGDLLKDSMTTVGEVAAAQAAGYHPDLCFMGVYAIHPEYGMTIPYPEEVSIKRQLIRSSSRVIALVNPIKLNTVSRYQVCGIEDFTTLITDGNVPQEMASRYKTGIGFPVKQFEPPGMGGSYSSIKNCVKMTVRFANINCTHLERSCTNVADKVRYR